MGMIEERRILMKFRHAYRKCQNCFNNAKTESKKNDFHQRMDKLLLVYSSLNNVSVNYAKGLLELNNVSVSRGDEW